MLLRQMKQSVGEGWGLRGALLWYVRGSQLAWEKGPQKVREGAGNMEKGIPQSEDPQVPEEETGAQRSSEAL